MSKKITELQLISAITDGVNIPGDNGLQTYRLTAAQLKAWILANGNITRAMLAVGAQAKQQVVSIANAQSPYTQIEAADIILVNGASGVTISPLTASSYSGKIVKIQKTDSSFGIVTITGVTALHTEGECVTLVSDGTNWVVLERVIPSKWTSWTPTGAFNTNSTYTGKWKREGKNVRMWARVAFSGTPNSAVAYTINLPSGIAVDTADMPSAVNQYNAFDGRAIVIDASINGWKANVNYNSSTSSVLVARSVTIAGANISDVNAVTYNDPVTLGNGDSIEALWTMPAANWNG